MWGQWIGSIKGTNQGSIILSIDHDRPYTGRISLHDQTGDRASQIISVELNISRRKLIMKPFIVIAALVLVSIESSSQIVWESTGGPNVGKVRTLATNPDDDVYAGTDGCGIHLTLNNGETLSP